MPENILDLEVLSTINVFPKARQENPVSTPLSIIDNTVANFSRCAAIWYFNPHDSLGRVISSEHLQSSLSETLNYYRPWCGRLSYAKPKPNGSHTERFQRIWITYNLSNDIGVPLVTAKTPRRLSEFILGTTERANDTKAWDASSVPSSELFPATKLASPGDPDAPNVIIQVTTFSCGSIAIAIEITHCLSDAVCLSQFAQAWALVSCSMLNGSSLPTLSPVFDPQLLDSFAAGNIDISAPDVEIQNRARALPQHRFDWYKPTPERPSLKVPADLDPTWEFSPSKPIPWSQWDTSAPLSQRVLHFSAIEIQNIYNVAVSTASTKISKHDALLAHIWTRINIARALPEGTQTYLDMTFGLRARVDPPLPDTFMGSPITHAAIPFPSLSPSSQTSSAPKLSETASQIRSTLSSIQGPAIAALLHDAAFEVDPQRIWRAALGREHILLTTWVHSGIHDVDFGGGGLRYVEAVMPACDGLVVVMEAPRPVDHDGKRGAEKGGKRNWTEDGVDVTVFLDSKAMERLLADEGLWGDLT